MSCKHSPDNEFGHCETCIGAVPDHIPEVQVAKWMYIRREQLKKDEDSFHSGSTRRPD